MMKVRAADEPAPPDGELAGANKKRRVSIG